MNRDTLQQRHWDIFCRVVDNFGDIGVSWRLARQLVSEHGVAVRLWVDHVASLHALCPRINVRMPRQRVEGVEVFQLADDAVFLQPAEVVIEAFGCGLPENYVAAMAASEIKPLWIVLEYLSAEPWVREHHGLPSPHPKLNLPRYFFFPGFTESTGGVLREADLLARRDAFDDTARRAWWSRHGFDAITPEAMAVSLFAYPHAPVQALLKACISGATPVVMAIPEGALAAQVRDQFQCGSGNLELRYMPFLPQADYDELLWACDINFVRGEDSFVRAQWAGRPLVWHIYPQDANAHQVKLEAFLDVYTGDLSAPAAQAVRGLWRAWNGAKDAPDLANAWQAFIGMRTAQMQGLTQWQQTLRHTGDLAGNLLRFCQKMI